MRKSSKLINITILGYTILFESIVDLLGTLRPFPNISMRILKKNFSWEVINSFIKRM